MNDVILILFCGEAADVKRGYQWCDLLLIRKSTLLPRKLLALFLKLRESQLILFC